jgi:hypothetical protein
VAPAGTVSGSAQVVSLLGSHSGTVSIGDATVAAANAAADDFTIDGEGTAVGMTISNSSDAGTGTIFFGDSTSSAAAGFRYNHNTGDMAISAEDNITITADAVGIGTTSPDSKLHVSSGDIRITNNSPSIYFYDSDVSGLYHRILGGGNKGLEYSVDPNNATAGYHRWDIGGSVVMQLIEGGNLGIGTTSPSEALHIYRNAASAEIRLQNNTI